MGESQDLIKLAERAKAATGADRELDARIAVAVNADSLDGAYKAMSDDPDVFKLGYVRHFYNDQKSLQESRRYTASIDAAMSLVPDGLGLELTTTGFKPGATVCGSSIFDIHEGAYAATPALALCAAALRARASMEKQG